MNIVAYIINIRDGLTRAAILRRIDDKATMIINEQLRDPVDVTCRSVRASGTRVLLAANYSHRGGFRGPRDEQTIFGLP